MNKCVIVLRQRIRPCLFGKPDSSVVSSVVYPQHVISSSVKMSLENNGQTPRRTSEMGDERLDLILHRMDLMRGAVDETCVRIKTVENGLLTVRTDLDKMAATNRGSGMHPFSSGSNIMTSDLGGTPGNIRDVPTDDDFGTSGYFDSTTLNGAYTQLRDSVQKVVLPAKMSMGDIGPNVKGDARRMLAFVRRTAGYSTTLLKVLKQVSGKPTPEESDWDSVFTIALALHKTLLAEQTTTVFEGSGVPQETLSMYRFLSKNASISASETMALENAARLTTAINMSKNNSGSDYHRGRGGRFSGSRTGGFSNFNQRGGRGYNNNFTRGSGRGGYQQTSDYFDSTVTAASVAKP
jgi:hypothetical protein